MAAANIAKVITLGSDWHSVSLGSNHSFYLVGIKETKGATDTIDPKDVKRISFELGIDAGLDTPLSIASITLNFDDHTSSDKNIDLVTAMVKGIGYPSEFKLRPTQIYTSDNKSYTQGTTTVSLNIVPVSFN